MHDASSPCLPPKGSNLQFSTQQNHMSIRLEVSTSHMHAHNVSGCVHCMAATRMHSQQLLVNTPPSIQGPKSSFGASAARNVNLIGTSQGMMVSVTITWLTMQLDFHLFVFVWGGGGGGGKREWRQRRLCLWRCRKCR